MSEFERWVAGLTPKARFELASLKIDRVVDLTVDLIHHHAANRLVLYSDALHRQIPRSYAGHAFKIFQRGMFQIELVKLARLWDPGGQHAYSVPTIWGLVRAPEVQAFMLDQHHIDPRSSETHGMLRRRWMRVNRLLGRRRFSPLRQSITNYRHRTVAHFLDRTREDEKPGRVRLPVYGDERRLLYRTVTAVNVLNLAIRRAGFMWRQECDNARRNAEALWLGCKFEILE